MTPRATTDYVADDAASTGTLHGGPRTRNDTLCDCVVVDMVSIMYLALPPVLPLRG